MNDHEKRPAHVARLLKEARAHQTGKKPAVLATKRALNAVTAEKHLNGISQTLFGRHAATPRLLGGAAFIGGAGALLPPWLLHAEFLLFPFCAAAGAMVSAWLLNWMIRQHHRSALANEVHLAQRFDQLCAEHEGSLPEDVVTRLHAIGQLLSGLLPALPEARQFGTLSPDALFFIEQTVERYLPEALGAFVAIPEARRGTAQEAGSPLTLLTTQLEHLHAELSNIDAQLATARIQRLAQHGRFLTAKHKAPGA